MASPQSLQTINLPPMAFRAEVGTINDTERTVELIFSTGAAVDRMDWWTGKRYVEKLSLDPAHIRIERLNAGGPLLDSHSSWSVTDQLGAVVPGTVKLSKKEARATVRFSKREQVEPIWQDVRDGIIRSVSVGYRVHKYVEVKDEASEKPPVRTAVDWEPFELSMVSMPADAGAKTRGEERHDLNQCVLDTRQQEKAMAEATNPNEQSEFIREETLAPKTKAAPVEERDEKNDADRGADAENERVQGIMDACDAARLPKSFARKLIADRKLSLLDAQRKIFVELKGRVEPTGSDAPTGGGVHVELRGDDPFLHSRKGIEEALLHRVNSEKFELTERGREYRGMSMLDIARTYLHSRGVRTTDMSRMELAGAALGLTQTRGGLHSTSDFPLLLADVANKSLRADYEAAPQTFMAITRVGSVPDFKLANRVQIGDAPALKPVGQHGEFTRGSIEEGREQVQAATYGRVFGLTRTALVNDDLDAFSRVPQKFGRMARNLESDLVWYQILKNAAMADGVTLFNASHSNYIGAGDIALGPMTQAERQMMLQTGIDGATLITAPPKYLIVPPNKKVQAQQFVSTQLQATTTENINPFAGQLTVIVEPRLETGITIGPNSATGSAYAWYLAADKAAIDIVELVFLEGQSGPVIESRVGFDVDGLEIKCRHDVGAKVIDHRGLFKSDGSDNS